MPKYLFLNIFLVILFQRRGNLWALGNLDTKLKEK